MHTKRTVPVVHETWVECKVAMRQNSSTHDAPIYPEDYTEEQRRYEQPIPHPIESGMDYLLPHQEYTTQADGNISDPRAIVER